MLCDSTHFLIFKAVESLSLGGEQIPLWSPRLLDQVPEATGKAKLHLRHQLANQLSVHGATTLLHARTRSSPDAHMSFLFRIGTT